MDWTTSPAAQPRRRASGPVVARALWRLMAVLALLALVGCAQQVGDIDRTQPNKLKKADLAGTWYMMETVTDLPTTSAATVIGETGLMEKVVWQIEENHLLAYRSYPRVPGGDDVDTPVDYNAADYHESPVAVFPILGHFDIQRSYDSSTGEQGNVIVENYSDRPWFEREFMRVDWSRNLVTNFDLLTEYLLTPIDASYQIDIERNEAGSMYQERQGDALVYFDVPRRLLVQPDFWGCVYSWYAWGIEDCAAAEVEMVTSFARTEARRDYEPLPYSDQDMSRFGYFRSERYVIDPRRGPLQSNRARVANRHNIWQASYEKNADGTLARDDQGDLIPIPMEEREVRTVPYYLSTTFPDDPLILEAAAETMRQWNVVGRQAAALAKGVSVEALKGDVFVLCQNPVVEGDHDACGAPGFSPRQGDLRYSTLHWVESSQVMEPLGYGPSACDPETGEIISGRAYVYGGGLNHYATYGVDVVRFMNGDIGGDELKNATHVTDEIRARTRQSVDIDRVSPRLKNVPLNARRLRKPEADTRRQQHRRQLKAFDRGAVDARLELARDAGLSVAGAAADEHRRAVAARLKVRPEDLDSQTRDRFDRVSWLNPTHIKQHRRTRMKAIARSMDFADLVDPNVLGTARKYEGRTDYEQIFREIRRDVFLATALHEVGHTVGLRHNFQGSYDSLNFFDQYWEQRAPTLYEPESMYDLYDLNALTDDQIEGNMRAFQYSSIMDYGMTFDDDVQGLGRYDEAALVYAYTAGTDGEGFRSGHIQTFARNKGELGRAGEILTSRDENGFPFDDATTPIVPYLERWHYTTVAQAFPDLSDMQDREWMRLDEFQAAREKGGDDVPVRVPYLFCSDEWAGALLSCQLFDKGADPFEMTRTLVDAYRAYYYFDNFKRDRLGWDPTFALFRYFFNIFLPLSDYFQNWYLAPEGADEVMDNYYWMSINTGFNLIAEALATPPYGTFCTGLNGNLVHLSDEPGQGPPQISDYFLNTYCAPNAPFIEIAQGDGRRRFTSYDVESGYYFGELPLEAGHYWTTLAAFWALVDPEAFVLGTDADVGTFAISYYDFFRDEIHSLVNAVITENYSAYSPLLEITGEQGDNLTGRLVQRVFNPIYDADEGLLVNPETGEAVDDTTGPDRRGPLCSTCDSNADCHGATGFIGGTYCQPIDDSGVFYCLQDCTDDAELCGEGFSCDDVGNCVPDDGVCVAPECSRQDPHGACPTGESCVEGTCEPVWPVVETDATFGLVDDMLFYGMLYTTFSYSTRYNDQLNVFKVGTGEAIAPGEGFEQISFVDPINGDAYGANVEACDGGDGDAPTGGSTGLCEPCEGHAECAGFTGNLGGAYCQPVESEDDEVWYCLIDCSEDADNCPDGTVCDEIGNCVPEDLSCDEGTDAGPCSDAFPLGSCDEGTCVEGECVVPDPADAPSARCQYGLTQTTGAAQMVLRGQELARRYNETLGAYYADDGSNPQRETRLFREFSRAQFEMESHIEKINDIRAVFAIFGRVY